MAHSHCVYGTAQKTTAVLPTSVLDMHVLPAWILSPISSATTLGAIVTLTVHSLVPIITPLSR